MECASELIIKLKLSELHSKYTVGEKAIGSGSYGTVYLGHDKVTGEKVAIKMLRQFPRDTIDRKRLFREIKTLHLLEGHANTICLKHITTSSNDDGTFLGMALIFKHHETDLSRIIRSSQNLTTGHLQYFLYQILTGVHYIHSANLVHRDLKPANILVDSNCDTTICDFGLARATRPMAIEPVDFLADNARPRLYRRLSLYVVTRWYRCPELLLENSNAGEAPADMWSVGCILAELLLRRPLFEKSNSSTALMKLIFDILGTPKFEDCEWIEKKYVSDMVKQYPIKPSQVNRIFAGKDLEAVDLLKKLLHFNPSKRLTAEKALQHPFFASYPHKEHLNFSMASMSEEEQKQLHDYYAFEVSSEGCDDQSTKFNQQLHRLIKKEIERYEINPKPDHSVASSSSVPTSVSTVPGTIFNQNKRLRSTSPIAESQHTEKPSASSVQSSPC
ncbi:MAG: protein kinase [Legionellaceae bacterium]|nr:protein kinase [Legionellaceae bacterium]